jgi:hypothetical protein
VSAGPAFFRNHRLRQTGATIRPGEGTYSCGRPPVGPSGKRAPISAFWSEPPTAYPSSSGSLSFTSNRLLLCLGPGPVSRTTAASTRQGQPIGDARRVRRDADCHDAPIADGRHAVEPRDFARGGYAAPARGVPLFSGEADGPDVVGGDGRDSGQAEGGARLRVRAGNDAGLDSHAGEKRLPVLASVLSKTPWISAFSSSDRLRSPKNRGGSATRLSNDSSIMHRSINNRGVLENMRFLEFTDRIHNYKSARITAWMDAA